MSTNTKGMKVERWVGGTCTVCQFWLKVSVFFPPTHILQRPCVWRFQIGAANEAVLRKYKPEVKEDHWVDTRLGLHEANPRQHPTTEKVCLIWRVGG